jgi:hypothetical protein
LSKRISSEILRIWPCGWRERGSKVNRVLESETLTRSAYEVELVVALVLGWWLVVVILVVWVVGGDGGDVVVGAGTKSWSVRL